MEVNDYYTKIKPSLRQFTPQDVIRASSVPRRGPFGLLLLRILMVMIQLRKVLRWAFFFGLVCVGVVEIGWLRASARGPRPRSVLHRRASELAPQLCEQYPLWPYSILIKALGWAFIEQHIPRDDTALELAIGEGSFSSRIFSDGGSVVGIDVNPVSLSKAARLKHVTQAIVADCLQPPIAPGSFPVVFANNFLHHISDKSSAVARWAAIAPKVVFNDCTPLWCDSWPVPWALRKAGFHGLAKFASNLLNRLGSQDLVSEHELDVIVADHLEVLDKQTYFAESTYLLATLPCLLALNVGPIPEELKRIALSKPFRHMTIALTKSWVKPLIDYDARQRRSDDVYLYFAGRSKTCTNSQAGCRYLLCQSCEQGRLDGLTCRNCGREYQASDGMLFLLKPALTHIEKMYDPVAAAAFATEHL